MPDHKIDGKCPDQRCGLKYNKEDQEQEQFLKQIPGELTPVKIEEAANKKHSKEPEKAIGEQ